MNFFQESGDNLFQTEAILLALFVVIILVGLTARYFRLPYTTILVVVGLGIGFSGVLPAIQLTPDLVLLLFLPPLAFEAAFHLDFDRLRQDLTPVTVFAVAGVILTMFVAAVILARTLGMAWELALLFGTLIAATDPVSVVAVFRELGVSKRLSTLIEAESLFNDGTSIVLFGIVLTIVLAGTFSAASSLVDFVRLVLGGIGLGLGLGYLAARVLARIDDYLIEITLTVVLAWGSYLLGQYLTVSGVITTVVAGLVLGNYGGRISFSPTTKIVLEHILEFVAFVANSLIFLLIGLQVETILLRTNFDVVLWAIVAAVVARAAAVYGLSLPLRWISTPIPLRWQHVLFWGGMRGGVTLALALSLPTAVPMREALVVAAFGVVLFTLVAQGLTIPPLVKRLGLVPKMQDRREFQKARARLFALRAAERRLARLHEQGTLDDNNYENVRGEYETRARALSAELAHEIARDPSLAEEETNAARLEGLRAQRSELFELNRRGLIADAVYRDLTAEIDAQLQVLAELSGEHRSIPPGPASSDSPPNGES